MKQRTRSAYFGAIANAILGQPSAVYGSNDKTIITQETNGALSVRDRSHSNAPALIRPKESPFIPLSAMAVPGLIKLMAALFNNEVTIGNTKHTTIIDPGTAAVLDVCGRVSLVKFDLLTKKDRLLLISTVNFDPILPIVSMEVLNGDANLVEYQTSMKELARLIPSFAKRPSRRFEAANAVTNLLSVIDALPLTVPERQFSAFHLKGLLDNPVAYM